MKVTAKIDKSYPHLIEAIEFYNKEDEPTWDTIISKELTLVEVSPNKIVWNFEVTESHCNQLGNLHGGCVATLIDLASSFAILVYDGKTKWKRMGVSTDLSVNYMLGVPAGENVKVECVVQRVGKNLANIYTVIYNEAGKICYTGSHTKFSIDSRL
ncbi:unnamed protein product [Cunninghamella echinulata]